MKKIYEVVVTQEYQSKGETKKKYINIGSVIEGEKGMSIKIESIPLNWNGWAAFYEPKPREENQATRQNAKAEADDFKDDLPF